jgi:uracil-DNA glycosylase family 4
MSGQNRSARRQAGPESPHRDTSGEKSSLVVSAGEIMTESSITHELAAVLAGLLDQVRYLETLGLSEVERELLRSEEPRIRGRTLSPARGDATARPMSSTRRTIKRPSSRSSTVSGERLTVHLRAPSPPSAAPLESSAMPRKRSPMDAGAQQSLFGEIPSGTEGSPTDRTLDEIRADVGDCTRCPLCRSRTTIVFGEGNPRARLLFVGEGPGADEDAQGRPFVGRAGQLLTRMIEAMGLRREDVYITNVVMCRPPGNRTPEADEIATCEPFLFRKIGVIQPDVVVALGAVAAQSLLRTKASISQIRGRFFDAHGTKVLPTFHPAFLLRSPEKKKEAWEDLKKVRDYLRQKRGG